MTDLESILFDYFATARQTLDEVYDWPVPERIPFGLFERGEDSHARANMRLRRFLSDVWKNQPEKREEIAKWYVGKWGGIGANKDETIKRYVGLSETQLAAYCLQGIASWSKILAVRNPGTYPIFDARVSASLGAIQFKQGVKCAVLFPLVPSRNKKILQYQEWIARKPRNAIARVPPSRTYSDYVSLLSTVAGKSGLKSPEELEMLLFANAETLIDQIPN